MQYILRELRLILRPHEELTREIVASDEYAEVHAGLTEMMGVVEREIFGGEGSSVKSSIDDPAPIDTVSFMNSYKRSLSVFGEWLVGTAEEIGVGLRPDVRKMYSGLPVVMAFPQMGLLQEEDERAIDDRSSPLGVVGIFYGNNVMDLDDDQLRAENPAWQLQGYEKVNFKPVKDWLESSEKLRENMKKPSQQELKLFLTACMAQIAIPRLSPDTPFEALSELVADRRLGELYL